MVSLLTLLKIERIIERSDPEAAARAKAEAEAAASAESEVGEDGELLGPQKVVKISPRLKFSRQLITSLLEH